jgi:protoporphyrinogen oxidase
MKIILGAGMTGLAAGFSSRLPVFEAGSYPGGICSSYYMHAGEAIRLSSKHPEDKEAFRFEIGGGHWIFGGDPLISNFIRSMVSVKTYTRKSSVYFSNEKLYVPFPIQHHLRKFSPEFTAKALVEIVQARYSYTPTETMADSFRNNFGPTLCDLFFDPFHELYTAGLWRKIGPIDLYKSPINPSVAIRGAFDETSSDGYNKNFIYPLDGLDSLARQIARRCNIHYGKQVIGIDVNSKRVIMTDGSEIKFETLISTLPLNRMIEMSNLDIHIKPDPYTSVLVINVGAVRGPYCPADHWIYTPQSKVLQ